MKIAGIDGTRKGWVVVTFDGATTDTFGVGSMNEALAALDDAALIAVDMPIGFLDGAFPGGRDCERAARAVLRRRASSVFSSPCRSALTQADYPAASAANRASSVHGLGLSKQAHAIFPKMREIDALMTPALQDRVFEIHPEVCFSELARLNGTTIVAGKKTVAGAIQRTALLESEGLAIKELRDLCRAFGADEDDVLDAGAAVWTALRRFRGLAHRLPDDPPLDARGLRMEMWV